ncbi:hypothetical protein [Spirosoma montaniterrae]|uniref:hypothetical protein n=1 Tax=Spirosoma montaniterrae TaxID=1178516 RepID=UPI001E2E6E46|nr:hypothetical protein [Spirosoma montaniterrae]
MKIGSDFAPSDTPSEFFGNGSDNAGTSWVMFGAELVDSFIDKRHGLWEKNE